MSQSEVERMFADRKPTKIYDPDGYIKCIVCQLMTRAMWTT